MNLLTKFLQKWANRRSFKEAVKQADLKRSITFKKYFVIKLAGEFHAVSKQRLKTLHKTNYFKKGVNYRQIERMAVYTTK